jgi:hypothetical protein
MKHLSFSLAFGILLLLVPLAGHACTPPFP